MNTVSGVTFSGRDTVKVGIAGTCWLLTQPAVAPTNDKATRTRRRQSQLRFILLQRFPDRVDLHIPLCHVLRPSKLKLVRPSEGEHHRGDIADSRIFIRQFVDFSAVTG